MKKMVKPKPPLKNNISGINKVQVYPNPNKGTFTVTLVQPELISGTQYKINIYNMMGQTVYVETLKQMQDNIIDISSQATGAYYYRVIKEDGSSIGKGKLIIEK